MKNGCIEKRLAVVGFRSRQRGASLLEGIAYLGIAAIVILGAVSLLTNAFGNAQANRSTEEIIALRTAGRKLFTGQTYPADMLTPLVTAKAVPGTLTVTTGTPASATNAWGGSVSIGNAAATGNSFTISYANVPKAECINILSGANGWTTAGVGTNTYTLAQQPVTTANATTACAGDTNTLTFVAT